MPTIQHPDIRPVPGDPTAGPHVIHYWEVVDNTARDALSVVANDIGRVCRVGSAAPYTFFVLTNNTGPAWGAIGTGASLSDATPQAVDSFSGSAGVSASASRADHVHEHGILAGGALHATAVAGASHGFMHRDDKSKLDRLSITTPGTVALVVPATADYHLTLQAAAGAGTASLLGGGPWTPGAASGNAVVDAGATSGSAGTVAVGATNASAVTIGRSGITTTIAGTLAATLPAHASTHQPGGSDAIATAAAVELTDSTNAEGNATSLARSNHQHAHGQRGGGSLHAVATPGVAGFAPVSTPITESGTTRTLTDADHGRVILCTHASGCAVTVPHTLTVGFTCTLVQRGGASAFVTAAGSGGLTVTPPAAFNASTAQGASPMTLYVESATVGLCWGDLDPV